MKHFMGGIRYQYPKISAGMGIRIKQVDPPPGASEVTDFHGQNGISSPEGGSGVFGEGD